MTFPWREEEEEEAFKTLKKVEEEWAEFLGHVRGGEGGRGGRALGRFVSAGHYSLKTFFLFRLGKQLEI